MGWSAPLRACLKIGWGPAARDFGFGQGGEGGASPKRAATTERRPQLPFCLAPATVALILALAGVARWAEIAADIGAALRALANAKIHSNAAPFQYFNSLLRFQIGIR